MVWRFVCQRRRQGFNKESNLDLFLPKVGQIRLARACEGYRHLQSEALVGLLAKETSQDRMVHDAISSPQSWREQLYSMSFTCLVLDFKMVK